MSASPQPSWNDPLSREVDQLLASLGSSGPRRASRSAVPGETEPAAPMVRPRLAPVVSSADAPGPWPVAALWARVSLGAALGAGMLLWPYTHRCGWPLGGYLTAVFMVLLSGAWVALVAWKARHAVAHVLALLLVFWGITLAAEQILPRIGYAAVPASWLCR